MDIPEDEVEDDVNADKKCLYEYSNLGYSENNNESEDEDPFLRDPHGFTFDSKEYKDFIAKGISDYGDLLSYGEAVKYVDTHKFNNSEMNNTDHTALYTCENCGLIFKSAKRFLIHHKWHNYGPPKESLLDPVKPEHNKKRKKKIKVEIDEANDDQEGNFECDICKQFYRTRRSLNNHKSRLHYAIPKECKICNKTFTNSSYLRSHMLTHTEGGTFSCSQCPKKFKFLHSLQRHIPTHYEDKNFQCDSCEKSFGSELLLKIHSKTHIKPLLGKHLKCSYCPKSFYQGFRLIAHERTHTGEKPFECSICKQRYPTNSSLSRHQKVSHSSELPYECEYCGKCFHIRSAWDYHVRRSHFKERPHVCDICGTGYSCQSDLAKHKKKNHEVTDESSLVGHSVDDDGPSKVKKKRKSRKRKKEYSDDST